MSENGSIDTEVSRSDRSRATSNRQVPEDLQTIDGPDISFAHESLLYQYIPWQPEYRARIPPPDRTITCARHALIKPMSATVNESMTRLLVSTYI